MSKGFTIIEIIIAIFILTVSIVGVYSAFSLMVFLTYDSSDRLTAAYLAQEGIEIVRNIRDINWITCTTPICEWEKYLVDCKDGCKADFKTFPNLGTGLVAYTGGSGDYLFIDNDGFYSYSTVGEAKQTKFKRKITITCFPDQDDCVNNIALKVVSEVIWDVKPNIFNLNPDSGNYLFKADETIYNWF